MDSLIIFNVILHVCWCGKKISSITGPTTYLVQWLPQHYPCVYMYIYTLYIILTVYQHPQIQIILKLIDFSLLFWGKIGSMWRHEPQRVRDGKHITRNIGRLCHVFLLVSVTSPYTLYFNITGLPENRVDALKQSTLN